MFLLPHDLPLCGADLATGSPAKTRVCRRSGPPVAKLGLEARIAAIEVTQKRVAEVQIITLQGGLPGAPRIATAGGVYFERGEGVVGPLFRLHRRQDVTNPGAGCLGSLDHSGHP